MGTQRNLKGDKKAEMDGYIVFSYEGLQKSKLKNNKMEHVIFHGFNRTAFPPCLYSLDVFPSESLFHVERNLSILVYYPATSTLSLEINDTFRILYRR